MPLLDFFCFPHARGGASTYYPWVNYLSPKIEIITIQLPGRANRFTRHLSNSLKDIAAKLGGGFAVSKGKPFLYSGIALGL